MEANEGHGPLWEGYPHFFVDEELQRVALKQDVFWQRKELTQKHNHWQREPGGKRPAHLLNKDRPELWNEAKLLFESRVKDGFPGSGRLIRSDAVLPDDWLDTPSAKKIFDL